MIPMSALAADDATMISTVFKIKTYDRNSVDGNYYFSHYGSAILIDKNRILTNAHVILDGDERTPTWYYEICRSEKSKKVPVCFTTAKLLTYDTIADIAMLELATPVSNKGVVFSSTDTISIGSSVIVYGYPSIGWLSITRTEWKMWGTDGLSYKFDGTIDHGNSGGGAFATDGKLIGMPYAVKSDNGTIGYIIPLSRIKDFLWGKTDNIERYTTKWDATFASYIKSIQASYKNPNNIKTSSIEIKNAEKNGFSLYNVVLSQSGDIFAYYFVDKNNRVFVEVSCSKDASVTWTQTTSYIQDLLPTLRQSVHLTTISTGSYLDNEKNTYLFETRDKKASKWILASRADIAYKNAPNCYSSIIATDVLSKDTANYNKAIAFAKSIKFTKPTGVKNTFLSSYYSLKDIPKNVYISEWAGFADASIKPTIVVHFPWEEVTSSDFSLLKFEDLDGYMNYDYKDTNQYSWTSYTFQAFLDRYITTGYNNVRDTQITTKNWKQLIMTVRDYSDRSTSPPKYEQNITFFYPFMTTTGQYLAYSLSFDLHTQNDLSLYQLRQVIESIEFPGVSPFKN
jgi:hypothetical protein